MWLTDVYSKESVLKHNKHIYKTVLSSCTYVVEKRLRRSFRDATYYSHPHSVDSIWNWILKSNRFENFEIRFKPYKQIQTALNEKKKTLETVRISSGFFDFCEISTIEILKNVVAFLEYMNFNFSTNLFSIIQFDNFQKVSFFNVLPKELTNTDIFW